jgi:chromosome segregation ATPase
MWQALALVGALAALVALLSAHRRGLRVSALEAQIDELETQNRRLQEDRADARGRLERATAELEELRGRLRSLEAERDELLERARRLEETASRLESARAELERNLSHLRERHAALESSVLQFQGEWQRQMTTLEEEIATLGRQLGEFRKGTRLPLPPGD